MKSLTALFLIFVIGIVDWIEKFGFQIIPPAESSSPAVPDTIAVLNQSINAHIK